MFQVIAFLLTGIFVLLTAAAEGSRGIKTEGSAKYQEFKKESIRQINNTKHAMRKNAFVRGKCRGELEAIYLIAKDIARTTNTQQAEGLLENARGRIYDCTNSISPLIVGIRHTPSGKMWYNQYVLEQKYRKDFQTYPKLKNQFEGAMERAYQNYRKLSRNDSMAGPFIDFSNYIKLHPHFQNPTLPNAYNKMHSQLIKERKRRTCDPRKARRCYENLMQQVERDSKNGLKNYCYKALREGQVCCSNPNKSCGDFAFAKEITSSFAKSTPAILQMFAQIRGIEGRQQEACKLSALAPVLTPLGNLQIDSCNQAIKGCKKTCNQRLTSFKNNFKKCFSVQKEESIKRIVRKALNESFEAEDPKAHCRDLIAEVAEAYKQISIDNSYNLSEESDYEELVACKSEIGRYAPGMGRGMGPAEQLAVNMCYGQSKPVAANAVTSPTQTMPYNPVTEVAGLAGTTPQRDVPSLSLLPEEEVPGAPEMEDEGDFLPPGPEPQKGKNVGFVPSGSGGGPGGSGAFGSASGGPSGRGREDGSGERELAKAEEDFPFQEGVDEEGGNDKRWEEGDDFGPQIEADRKRAEELKKLPKRYLTQEEKDLVRAFSPPGKHESIFEFHTFFFHWFCINYGCAGYFKAMGIPESMRRKIIEPKFKKKTQKHTEKTIKKAIKETEK